MFHNKFLKNKKAISLLAQDIPMWSFRFFLLIFIIAGIVLTVYSFYSHNIDTTEIEAGLIANKIASCIIKEGVLQDTSSLSLENCGLNLNLEDNYINMTLEGKSISFGNSNLELLCRLKDIAMEYKPFCLRQKYYAVKKGSGTAYLDLLVASIKGLK